MFAPPLKGSKDEVDLGAPMLHETAEVLLDLIELTKPVTIRHAEGPQKPERDSGLPPSLDDWLPKGHLARFVADIVDQLDLSALIGRYRGAGSAAYHPAMLLALIIYGYATGTYSSRRIEQATYDSRRFATSRPIPTRITIRCARSASGS